MKPLSFENIENKLSEIVSSEEWGRLYNSFASKKHIIFCGNGGNFSEMLHGTIDISRLTDKYAHSPASGVVATSLIGEVGFENYYKTWLEMVMRTAKPEETMVMVVSCSSGSKSSKSLENAIQFAHDNGYDSFILTAQRKKNLTQDITQVVSNLEYYHSHEVLGLMLCYQLIHTYTSEQNPPKIKIYPE